MIELYLNNESVELASGTYKQTYSNVDTTQTSEGGTTLRSVTRTGIPSLDVGYTCDGAVKAKLENFSKAESLTATLYDENEGDFVEWLCYMSGFSAELKVENSDERFYKVRFKLNDLEEG